VRPSYYVELGMALVAPAGIFWYGWTVQAKVQFMAPILGAGFFCSTMSTIMTCSQDLAFRSFGDVLIAERMLTAIDIVQAVFGFAFPLFARQMLATLGNGGGYSLLGGLAFFTGNFWLLAKFLRYNV